jgi:hypothetical protein
MSDESCVKKIKCDEVVYYKYVVLNCDAQDVGMRAWTSWLQCRSFF